MKNRFLFALLTSSIFIANVLTAMAYHDPFFLRISDKKSKRLNVYLQDDNKIVLTQIDRDRRANLSLLIERAKSDRLKIGIDANIYGEFNEVLNRFNNIAISTTPVDHRVIDIYPSEVTIDRVYIRTNTYGYWSSFFSIDGFRWYRKSNSIWMSMQRFKNLAEEDEAISVDMTLLTRYNISRNYGESDIFSFPQKFYTGDR